MSNFYVCYSDEAQDDLRNVFMHIAYELGSRDNAEGQVNRIREAIKKLDKFPKRNPPVPYEPCRKRQIHPRSALYSGASHCKNIRNYDRKRTRHRDESPIHAR